MTIHARIVLRREAFAAQAARDFLALVCRARNSTILDDAQLLISELVTNAVRYGSGPIVVDVACGPDIEVRVHDRADELPRPRRAKLNEEGGRGLALLDFLSDDWGIEAVPPGKTVWFRLASS